MAKPAAVGNRWEQVALDYLAARSLALLARNFHCRLGELDLVMRDGNCVVFVEVRYRARNRVASAAVSIGPQKQRKIGRAAAIFLSRHPELKDCTARFDVVALDAAAGGGCTLQWLRDAFRPEI